MKSIADFELLAHPNIACACLLFSKLCQHNLATSIPNPTPDAAVMIQLGYKQPLSLLGKAHTHNQVHHSLEKDLAHLKKLSAHSTVQKIVT